MSCPRALKNFSKPRMKNKSQMIIFIWFLVEHLIFKSALLPAKIRPKVLQAFGASIGNGTFIRRGVLVHFPWNLEIGDNCWIGEGVWFIATKRITLESDVCVSQRAIICSGSHDFKSKSLQSNPQPILIRSGSWICLGAYVLAGVTIGECSVVSAGEIVRKSLPDYSMLVGGQVRQIDPPK